MADNTEFQIDCPACGEQMQKIYMPEQNIHLDVCVDGCGGIFFDNRELDKFDEKHEDITPLVEVLENKTFKKIDGSEKRTCPLCGNSMVKNFASSKREIQIDECYSCGGKFLDNSELEKIRGQYNTEEERAADVINELYASVGTELDILKAKHAKMKLNPSLLSRVIRFK